MFVKICGITQVEQGRAIAQAFLQHGLDGKCAIGFICTSQSKRFLAPERIREIVASLPAGVETIGVFVDESSEQVAATVLYAGLSGVQLHGNESEEYCRNLRGVLVKQKIVKALRLKKAIELEHLLRYRNVVDAYLIDAYHPQQAGGTGLKADWTLLRGFAPDRPWLLAGGLTPENVKEAIAVLNPNGIDVSSGVEITPGIKDLQKVELLLESISELATA